MHRRSMFACQVGKRAVTLVDMHLQAECALRCCESPAQDVMAEVCAR